MSDELATDGGRVAVCPADEMGPGNRRLVTVDGTSVGVLNVDGEYFALENACKHDAGPVCKGRVSSRVVGEHQGLTERVEERFGDDLTITCPWHGWEYTLETGTHVGDDTIALRTFDVVVDEGVVYVEY